MGGLNDYQYKKIFKNKTKSHSLHVCFRTAVVTLDANSESTPDDLVLADAPALRRQVRTRSVNTGVTPLLPEITIDAVFESEGIITMTTTTDCTSFIFGFQQIRFFTISQKKKKKRLLRRWSAERKTDKM